MKGFGLRRLLFPIGIFAATQFMSCKTDDAVEDMNGTSDVPKEQKEEPSLNYRALFSTHHTIGEEEAKELALDASSLFSGDSSGLKSGKVRQICDVRVLHSEETTLRSGSGEEVHVPDTLAYVCNFADSAGFAIICADDRVGCPISLPHAQLYRHLLLRELEVVVVDGSGGVVNLKDERLYE
ncbi:MAG: hypothetical protein IKX43_04720 [Paludibacteraceae bacterium]|nr:hypothetical protein [Paludibacteraceae bacterium]